MFEVLPSGNPVILCFGWWFWEVALKVIRIDVSKNVPQHLAVLYVLPALYLLGRLKCLHLAKSAGSNEMLLRTVVPISAGLLPTLVEPRLPCRRCCVTGDVSSNLSFTNHHAERYSWTALQFRCFARK